MPLVSPTMYCEYWQLTSPPFGAAIETERYYPSESHQGALLKMRYAVESGSAAAVLSGLSGNGKTLLVHKLREQLPENFAPFVHVVFPDMSSRELIHYLAEELGAPAVENASGSTEESIRRLDRFFKSNIEQGKHAVIVIDEADLFAEGTVLETIRLLMNFEHQGKLGATFLLVGQPALLTAVDRRPGLNDRIAVRTLLRAFTADETAAYIQHRLNVANATRTIFDDSAFEALHAISRGIPRAINRLCDLALLIGYAEGQTTLSAQHIELVSEELIAVSPE